MKTLYSDTANNLKQILDKVKYVVLTTDIWTSKNNDAYLTVTCHFINLNFQLQNAVLATKLLNVNHTAENIAYTLKEICTQWEIKNKISCIVTDNAANMIKGCNILKKRQLSCYAHTLNLAVQDMLHLDIIKPILGKCKEIVKFFKSSTVASGILKQEQQAINNNFYKLVKDVPTRWISCYAMVNRILEIADAVNRSLIKLRNAPLPLTIDEIAISEHVKKKLSCFEEATKKVSGTNYITISIILPLSYGIYNHLTNLYPELKTDEGKVICNKIMHSVTEKLFPYELRSVPRIATVLYPRFKKVGFRNLENFNHASAFLELELNNIMKDSSYLNADPG